MDACRYAGCVLLATIGDLCPVHARHMGEGKACTHCAGSGHLRGADGLRPCDVCCGTGLVDDTKRNPPRRGTTREPVAERGLIVESERQP